MKRNHSWSALIRSHPCQKIINRFTSSIIHMLSARSSGPEPLTTAKRIKVNQVNNNPRPHLFLDVFSPIDLCWPRGVWKIQWLHRRQLSEDIFYFIYKFLLSICWILLSCLNSWIIYRFDWVLSPPNNTQWEWSKEQGERVREQEEEFLFSFLDHTYTHTHAGTVEAHTNT